MKAVYPSSPALFDSTTNGFTFVMEVDGMTGTWIMPPDYPRYCGYSAQVGMDVCSPVMRKRECGMRKESAVKPSREWSNSSQQAAPLVSTTSRQSPSCARSASPSNSAMEDSSHGVQVDAKSRCSNLSTVVGGGITSSAFDSGDIAFPARRQRRATSIEAALPCDGKTNAANVRRRSDELCESPERPQAKSSCSFADLYVPPKEICPADLKDSTLFSKGDIASSAAEEVIFPKRKNRADRNAWRDWTNSGYADLFEDYNHDAAETRRPDNGSTDSSAVTAASYVDNNVHTSAAPSSLQDDTVSDERFCIRNTEESSLSISENSLSSGCDPRDDLQSCDRETSFSYDILQSESKATDGGEFAGVSGGTGRSSTRKEQRGRGGGQKLSPGFRGVWCKQRSFNRSFNQSAAEKFPPPLESLSRHKSQRPANQMPWVQLQHIRSHGRVMLQEVEVTQPVVFEPIRKDGRLVLHLLDQNDDVEDSMPVASEDMQSTSPVTSLVKGISAAPIEHDGESITDVVANDVAQSEGREATEAEAPLETRKADEGEAHQLPEDLSLPRKEEWKRAVKVWPESREGLPSSSVTGDCMAQKVDEAASRQKMDDAAPRQKMDDAAPRQKMDDAASRQKMDDAASRQKMDDAASRQKMDDAASRQKMDDAASRQKMDDAASRQKMDDAASGQNVDDAASEQKMDDAASGSASLASPVQILERNRSGSFHDCVRDTAHEAKPSLAVYESIIRDSFLSFTSAHSFLRSLSGRVDPDLSDFASSPLGGGKSFSCAGIGKGGHGNTFCHQSPYVS